MKNKAPQSSEAILRQRAEEILKNKTLKVDTISIESETLKLIHELDVHQIELEMQNEEIKLAKEQLEVAAEKYINLYDFAPSGYFTLSKNGDILELNFRGANMLGKGRSQLINNRFAFFVTDETRSIFNSFLDKIFDSKMKETCEITLSVNPNTDILTYLLLDGITIEDEEQCFITAVDISKRKKAEEELKKSQSLLQSTIESQKDIIIFSIDKNYKYLNFNKAHRDIMKFAYDSDIQLGINILDCITSDSDRKVAKENFDRALNGESHSNIREFGAIEIAYFESFFNPIIANDEIIGATALAKNITKRIEDEKTLWISEERYRTLFDSNRDSITIYRFNPDGKLGNFIEANTASTDIFGYTKAELLSMTIRDLEPVSAKIMKTRIETLQSSGKVDFETSIRTKKGKTRSVEIESLIINYLEEPAVMNITRDITERKQIESNSKKAHENLTTILEAIPDLMFEVGLDGRIYHYHSDRDDLLAVPPEEFMGKFFKDVLPADVSNICMEAIEEASEKGWSGGHQYSLDLVKGEHWFELSVSLINESDVKDKHFILLARDITKRKQAEKIQTDSLDLIEKITSRVPGVVYQFKLRPDGTFCLPYASDGINKIYDLNPDEVKEDASKIFKSVHPDDLDRILASIHESAKNLTPWKQEYRVKFKNGVIRNVYGTATPQLEKDGSVLWYGFVTDTTDKKIIEDSLRESEERIRNLLDSTDGIIWEADALTLNFTFVSKEAERLFGYPIEDWYSPGFWINHLHPEDKNYAVEYCISRIKQIKLQDFTYRFISKDGTVVWLSDMVNVVAEEGKPLLLRGVMFNITRQKQIEESLRESEEKYRSLVENSPDAVVIYDIEGKIVFVNDEGVRMVAAKNKDEIMGKPVLQFIHPDSLASITQRMEEVIRDANASDIVEEKFIDLNGKPIDVEIKGIPTVYEHKDAVQVIIHNITERKRTQEKIKHLSQAVEQSPVTIIITNTAGAIEYVNPKFSETTGYSFDEVVGQNPRILKSAHTSPDEYKQLWQTLAAGNEWHGEFHNVRKDGELYWESASISPIVNAQGKTTHYIAIKEDITNRKKVEKQLIKAKEKAEESDRLKLAFLANMSHEIRTPMNGILGFTELLKTPNLAGEEQQEYIRIIERSGIRMLNIINDIISISKVESGQVEISLSETNINEQIKYLYTFFKPEAAQKGIHLSINNPLSSKEAVINTDREKVYAILTNLVKNALKFTDSGSIEFGYVKKGNLLEFFVKDTGFGISKSHKKIIFERFRQGNETVTRTHEGSGLGLAISKAYVEMLGGEIWVESKKGEGSSFYFTIPFENKSEPKDTIISKKAVAEEKKENEIKDLKVLIVEDDSISKLLITIAVRPFSKEILKVSTGFEAVEACRNNPDIDLVMMDINMPEMDGYEATKQIREFNKNLIIIAQTANGMQSDRDEAIAAGCTDYISKPVNIAALSELIQKYYKK